MIELGQCDDRGYRDLYLISRPQRSSSRDRVQWLIDGTPVGPVQPTGVFVTKVFGDGEEHEVELRFVSPRNATSTVERAVFASCERSTVVAHITSIDYGECDSDGNRPLLVSARVNNPDRQPVALQWYVDGVPLGDVVEPGEHAGTIVGDGRDHVVEVRVVSPVGAVGDAEPVTIPECERPVRVRIRSVTFGDCNDDGTRQIHLVPSIVSPRDVAVVVQWLIDGAPLSAPTSPEALVTTVRADGQPHTIELRIVEPGNIEGHSKQVTIPSCDRSPTCEIVSVVIADECTATGTRVVTLVSQATGDEGGTVVRWLLDGEQIVEPGEPGEVEIELRGGSQHELTLEAVGSDGRESDSRQIEIPACVVHVDQSDWIYLQAVGSDGSDDTLAGAHLRWDLLGELGANHLPKGNAYSSGDIGFSRPDDFVTVKRYPYVPVPIEIDAAALSGGSVDVLAAGGPRTVVLQPGSGGTEELSVAGERFFAFEISFAGPARLEVLTERNGIEAVILRRRVTGTFRAEVDNATAIRFDGGALMAAKIETYSDLVASQATEAIELGKFALTVDDSEVEARLTAGSASAIESWPKFDGGRVVVANYLRRWSDPQVGADDGGLKDAVQQYLTLSRTDPRAVATYQSDIADDLAEFKLSLVDALQLSSLDFHSARMLGLGTIDTDVGSGRFMYCVEYRAPLQPSVWVGATGNDPVQTYFSLPTGQTDQRLPHAPVLKPVTYGVKVPSSTGSALTDDGGYSKWSACRYINVSVEADGAGPKAASFFADHDEFDVSAGTGPSLVGLEYRKLGESLWRRCGRPGERLAAVAGEPPGLPGDSDFLDHDGYPEPTPFVSRMVPGPWDDPAQQPSKSPIFTHEETEPGAHEYGAYNINWFSRRSPLGLPVRTDETVFSPRCLILPPSPVMTHLVQPEQPPVLTSLAEQDPDTGRLGQVRVMWGWGPAQCATDPTANEISFVWRSSAPSSVTGKVASVIPVGQDEAIVGTTRIELLSTGHATELIEPLIAAGDEPWFVGAHLATESGVFEVLEVVSPNDGGPYMAYRVRKQRQASADKTLGPNGGIKEAFYGPLVGELFAISENINATGNSHWRPLSKKFPILCPTGLPSTTASIATTDPVDGDPLVDGVYAVALPDVVLPPTNDPDVEWAGGSLTCVGADGNDLTLAVLRLGPTNGVLYAVVQSSEQLATGIQPVVLYPGSRAYLHLGSGAGVELSDLMPVAPDTLRTTYLSAIASNPGGCRSELSGPSQINAVRITTPVPPRQPTGPLWATKPDPHFGRSTYTVDVEFETSGDGGPRTPFGFIVERATLGSVLSVLYRPATVTEIWAAVGTPASSPVWQDRWVDLVNVADGATSLATLDGYALPTPDHPDYPYAPPPATGVPAPATFDGATFDPAMIRSALELAFVPITESPLLFADVEPGHHTSPDAPRTKDRSGAPLDPASPEYRPCPMARRLPGADATVRFTDYTLDGASNGDVYFYRVREISESLFLSDPSPAVGPVRLINTRPMLPPTIVKSYVRLGTEIEMARQAAKDRAVELRAAADAGDPPPPKPDPIEVDVNDPTFEPPAVVFEIAPYLPDEEVTHIRIYRAFDKDAAQSIHTMELVAELDADDLAFDDFADLANAPIGRTIWHRLVACRRVARHGNLIETVQSLPSQFKTATLPVAAEPRLPTVRLIGPRWVGPDGRSVGGDLEWDSTGADHYLFWALDEDGNWQPLPAIADQQATTRVALDDVLGIHRHRSLIRVGARLSDRVVESGAKFLDDELAPGESSIL